MWATGGVRKIVISNSFHNHGAVRRGADIGRKQTVMPHAGVDMLVSLGKSVGWEHRRQVAGLRPPSEEPANKTLAGAVAHEQKAASILARLLH